MEKIKFYVNKDANEESFTIDNGKKAKLGFTLIEVIAVICIICILAAALLPKFTGYIKEAKKLVVIDQSRKVIMAVESYNIRADVPIKDTEDIASIVAKDGVKVYLEDENLDKIKKTVTLEKCRKIVSGESFNLDDVSPKELPKKEETPKP